MVSTGAVLAFDTSSFVVTVAVAREGRVLALREGGQRESSAHLLAWIDATLAAAGIARSELAGLVALAGPGSFTGLRVGLATALGIHQALGLAATAMPTFAALAAALEPGCGPALALVPALPGEWYAQVWTVHVGSVATPPVPLGEPHRLPTAELGALAAGGGAELLVAAQGVELAAAQAATGLPARTAGPLAAAAARLASLHPPCWDAAALASPLYLAPAPATPAREPKRVLAPAPRRGGSR
jgi:tRNA threonylcarbamoyladenosine biosynthesis protein TsaB